MRPLLLLIALLLALPLAACAGEEMHYVSSNGTESTFVRTDPSMDVSPYGAFFQAEWNDTEGERPLFGAIVWPEVGGQLVVEWALRDHRVCTRMEVRVDGKLLGTETWLAGSEATQGAYALKPERPLKRPLTIELTAWSGLRSLYGQPPNRDKQVLSTSVSTADLSVPRLFLRDLKAIPNPKGEGVLLRLWVSRPWVQVSLNGQPMRSLGLCLGPNDIRRIFPMAPGTLVYKDHSEVSVPGVRPWHYITIRAVDPLFGGAATAVVFVWPSETVWMYLSGLPLAILVLLPLVLLAAFVSKRLARGLWDDPSKPLGWTSWLPLGGWALARQGRWTLAWWCAAIPMVAMWAVGLQRDYAPGFWATSAWRSFWIFTAAWAFSVLLGLALARRLGPSQTPAPPLRQTSGVPELTQLFGCIFGLMMAGFSQLCQRRGPVAWRFLAALYPLIVAVLLLQAGRETCLNADLRGLAVIATALSSALTWLILGIFLASLFEPSDRIRYLRHQQLAAQQPAPEGGAQAGPNPSS